MFYDNAKLLSFSLGSQGPDGGKATLPKIAGALLGLQIMYHSHRHVVSQVPVLFKHVLGAGQLKRLIFHLAALASIWVLV